MDRFHLVPRQQDVMNWKAIEQAEETSRWAEQDLVDAKAFGHKALPEAKRIARQMARAAKRRRAKAQRRVSRLLCNEHMPQ